MALLDIENLQVHFRTRDGINRAVDGVSFHVDEGETLAIVGESGCGKSVTALSILRLIPEPPGKIAGSIRFQGKELLQLSDHEMRAVRGNDISMVFQEPMTSLNPGAHRWSPDRRDTAPAPKSRQQSGHQACRRDADPRRHRGPAPAACANYPHQLSGGMRQRVMIAIALACNPKLLIADEPTTALDVTIQAQILDLMQDLKRRVGAAIVLITHDLGVVAEVAERVIVMYAGRKVEEAPVAALFRTPLHPYTKGLLGAVPKLGSSLKGASSRLAEIPAPVPEPQQRITGCVFAGRCALATDLCRHDRASTRSQSPRALRRLPLCAKNRRGGMSALLQVNDLTEAFLCAQRAVGRRHRPSPCGGRCVIPYRSRRNAGRWLANPDAASPRSGAPFSACSTSPPVKSC